MLYQATNKYACAGFETKNDYVSLSAPILKKHIMEKHITSAILALKKLGYKIEAIENGNIKTI